MKKIAIITDFGTKDPYVGIMKGKILSFLEDVVFIDITHDIPEFDVTAGLFIFKYALKHLPEDFHFLIVIDPGVGGKRRPIFAVSEGRFFVAPDNGILTPLKEIADFYEITMFKPESSTFHGRDIFAPALGKLLSGTAPDEVGKRIHDPEEIYLPEPEKTEKGLLGRIIYIDRFGNLITNITAEDVRIGERVMFKNRLLMVVNTYQDVRKGEPLALIDSFEHLEIAVREGNAKEFFDAKVGDPVLLEK